MVAIIAPRQKYNVPTAGIMLILIFTIKPANLNDNLDTAFNTQPNGVNFEKTFFVQSLCGLTNHM